MVKATIIGVPLDLGAQNLGVDIGPNAIRYQNIKTKLENSGFRISDTGNIPCINREQLSLGNTKLKYLDEILRVSEKTASLVFELLTGKEKIIALGGDHSICLGTVSGASSALKGNLGLIYLDAHGDLNTDKTSVTGNIHGMHLASLLGFGDIRLIQVFDKSVKINKKNLLHIGGYDLDRGEIALIKKEKLATYKLFDILSDGLAPLLLKIVKLTTQVKNIWVSLDLDVIDSAYAPGSGMPNKAGLTYREISTICEYIGHHCHVVGVDIVEYNPLQDIGGKTAELAIELIAKLFGSNYSWYTNYLANNK
jgi:arginase